MLTPITTDPVQLEFGHFGRQKRRFSRQKGSAVPNTESRAGGCSSNLRQALGGSTTNFDHFAPKDRCRSSPPYNPITTVSPGEKDGLAEKRTTALDTEGISSSIRDPRLITSISGVPLPTLSTLLNRGRPGPLEIRIRLFCSVKKAILPIDWGYWLTRSLSSYRFPPLPDNARPTLSGGLGRINLSSRAITTRISKSKFGRSGRLRFRFYRQTGFYRRGRDTHRRSPSLPDQLLGLSRQGTAYSSRLYYPAPAETFVRSPARIDVGGRNVGDGLIYYPGSVPQLAGPAQ